MKKDTYWKQMRFYQDEIQRCYIKLEALLKKDNEEILLLL